MNSVEEVLNIIDRGGVIAILIFVIYQGKKIIDYQTQKFIELQKETNHYIRDILKVLGKLEK